MSAAAVAVESAGMALDELEAHHSVLDPTQLSVTDAEAWTAFAQEFLQQVRRHLVEASEALEEATDVG